MANTLNQFLKQTRPMGNAHSRTNSQVTNRSGLARYIPLHANANPTGSQTMRTLEFRQGARQTPAVAQNLPDFGNSGAQAQPLGALRGLFNQARTVPKTFQAMGKSQPTMQSALDQAGMAQAMQVASQMQGGYAPGLDPLAFGAWDQNPFGPAVGNQEAFDHLTQQMQQPGMPWQQPHGKNPPTKWNEAHPEHRGVGTVLRGDADTTAEALLNQFAGQQAGRDRDAEAYQRSLYANAQTPQDRFNRWLQNYAQDVSDYQKMLPVNMEGSALAGSRAGGRFGVGGAAPDSVAAARAAQAQRESALSPGVADSRNRFVGTEDQRAAGRAFRDGLTGASSSIPAAGQQYLDRASGDLQEFLRDNVDRLEDGNMGSLADLLYQYKQNGGVLTTTNRHGETALTNVQGAMRDLLSPSEYKAFAAQEAKANEARAEAFADERQRRLDNASPAKRRRALDTARRRGRTSALAQNTLDQMGIDRDEFLAPDPDPRMYRQQQAAAAQPAESADKDADSQPAQQSALQAEPPVNQARRRAYAGLNGLRPQQQRDAAFEQLPSGLPSQAIREPAEQNLRRFTSPVGSGAMPRELEGAAEIGQSLGWTPDTTPDEMVESLWDENNQGLTGENYQQTADALAFFATSMRDAETSKDKDGRWISQFDDPQIAAAIQNMPRYDPKDKNWHAKAQQLLDRVMALRATEGRQRDWKQDMWFKE